MSDEDTLTVKDVEQARDTLLGTYRVQPYMVHPKEHRHLAEHGGGRGDCLRCQQIWNDAQAARALTGG